MHVNSHVNIHVVDATITLKNYFHLGNYHENISPYPIEIHKTLRQCGKNVHVIVSLSLSLSLSLYFLSLSLLPFSTANDGLDLLLKPSVACRIQVEVHTVI